MTQDESDSADQRAIDFINECSERGLITAATDAQLKERGCDICKTAPLSVGHVTGDAPGLEIHYCSECWAKCRRFKDGG